MITTSKKKQLQAIVQGGRTQSKATGDCLTKRINSTKQLPTIVKHNGENDKCKFQILLMEFLKSDKSPN
jgi:hypothetical protein